MASSFRFFWNLYDTIAGLTTAAFSHFTAVKDTTLPDSISITRTVILPARTGGTTLDPVKVWDYTEGPDFEILAIQIEPNSDGDREGLAWIGVTVDTFTAGEPDGGGNAACAAFVPLSCTAPFVLNSDSAAIQTTAADRAGLTSGVPTIFTDAGTNTETGKVSAVYAANDSADTEIRVTVWVRG